MSDFNSLKKERDETLLKLAGYGGDESADDENASSEVDNFDEDEGEETEEEDTGTGKCLADLIKIKNDLDLKKLQKKSKSANKDSIKKRRNKNCPQELSSKRKIPLIKQAPAKKVRRDPRFDSLGGNEFNAEIFHKNYKFVDGIKENEQKKLKKQLKRTKNSETKQKLQSLIFRNDQQLKAKERREEMDKKRKEWKDDQIKKVTEGKQPYFLKKSDQKKLFEPAGKSSKAALWKIQQRTAKEKETLNVTKRFNKGH